MAEPRVSCLRLVGPPHLRKPRSPLSHDPNHHAPDEKPSGQALAGLSLAALGVVYGDIGTSPIYALRESLHGKHGLTPTPENVLGLLSLIVWALILVISVKYLAFVMRADNCGEGGMIALTALVSPPRDKPSGRRASFVLIGLFGASLLYGDGMITPAISVLSAVEGLEVATPVFRPYIVPITIAILIVLFAVQSRGTARIGSIFGPVMLLWFARARGVRGDAHHRAPVRADGGESTARREILRAQRRRRLPRARLRVPRGDRRRGALRGHGPLRQATDPLRVVRARAAGAADQLLRPGRARHRRSQSGRASVLSAGAGVGADPARRSHDASQR